MERETTPIHFWPRQGLPGFRERLGVDLGFVTFVTKWGKIPQFLAQLGKNSPLLKSGLLSELGKNSPLM